MPINSDIPLASDPLPPAETRKAFPAPVEVRGYQDFPKIEKLFRQEYINTSLVDVRGIRIHFHNWKPNEFKDFEHAAIGKEGVQGGRPEPCDTWRASCCVYWIRFVVTHPDVEIFHAPSRSGGVPPDQERDIYRWKGQEGPGQIFYRYQVVVTRYLNAPEKTYFLTAYPLDIVGYGAVAKHYKQVYPSRTQRGRQNTPAVILESAMMNESASQRGDAATRPTEDTTNKTEGEIAVTTPIKPMSRNDRKRLRRQGIAS